MRLSEDQLKIINETIKVFDPKAKIRLFGSRIKDENKGGDIDLLILSNKLRLRDKLLIRSQLKEKLGNRKIDIILTKKPTTAFEKYAFNNSVQI